MIEFRDIALKFHEKQLFDGFNLTINDGEKVVLKAASGSGKSTLLKMVLGFVKPDRGHVFIDGIQMSRQSIHHIRQTCGYVSQDVDFRNGPVEETIKAVFEYKANRHLTYDRDKLLHFFDELDLERDSINKKVHQLSGGERQRLGFILCILLERKIWLLDEVTSGLDSNLKDKIVNWVASSDKTVITISHDDVWLEDDRIKVVSW